MFVMHQKEKFSHIKNFKPPKPTKKQPDHIHYKHDRNICRNKLPKLPPLPKEVFKKINYTKIDRLKYD